MEEEKEVGMIEFQKVCKTYRVAKRQAGFRNAVKSLFSREYETVQALDNVSFRIADGEIIGYIGPNGAGKSTTVKVMCGILTPDSGNCLVNGKIPWKERAFHVKDIGVVFGQRSQLWWDVPVIDSFELLRDMYKMEERRYRHNLEELARLLELSELLKTPARNLSLGQRMRCEIAASLLHEPKVLFLDEPTIGLDAVSKIAVRQFVKKIKEEKHTTVVLTTHDMMDIEALADRVLLIGHGRILLDGTLEELKRHTSTEKIITIKYTGSMPAVSGGMELREAKENQLTVALDPAILPVSAAIASLASQTELLDVSVTDISAEEVVAALYKEYRI